MQPVLQRKFFPVALLIACTLSIAPGPVCLAADSQQDLHDTVSTTAPESDATKKEIEKLLVSFEHDWNSHNLDSVMAFYADDYFNNDGFDKTTLRKLTDELWKTYPDIKNVSFTKQIRIEGHYATVESRDEAQGNTAVEFPGLSSKGELKSLSEGQLYLKHVGMRWLIIGDRIDFEKIKVAYGAARQLDPVFAAPEQVKAGKQFSARLEVELPPGFGATGSISQVAVSFPSQKIMHKYKSLGDPLTEHPQLERVMTANTKDRNELLMADIGLTNASGSSIMGVVMVTRRLNVIPVMEDDKSKIDSAKAAASPDQKSEEPAGSGSVR